MWDIVKENVKYRHPKSLDELWDVLKDEWNKIPNSTIKSFYNSLPKRVQAVMTAKRYSTKY